MLNALHKQGWRTRYIGHRDLSAITGRAIALGLGVYNRYRQLIESQGRTVGTLSSAEIKDVTKYAMDVGLGVKIMALNDLEKDGFIINSNAEGYVAEMEERICRTLIGYIANDPIPAESRIVAVEHNFGPEYGNAQADLIIQEHYFKRIIDYKTKIKADTRTQARDEEGYRDNHQLFHYLWAWRQQMQEFIPHYSIGYITTQPYSCKMLPFPVNEEALDLWAQSVQSVWRVMEMIDNGDMLPWMTSPHEDKWGVCEMYEACFKHRLNEQAMKSKYIKVGQ
jgi:hypothetical protein